MELCLELWIATQNSGKLKEFQSLFVGVAGLTIHSLKDIPAFVSPPENGKTFEENARLKAKSLFAVKNNSWVLADDSGLEIEGLNNMPGIYSARYAGDHASDQENVAKAIKMLSLRSFLNRKAQFQCVLVAYSPSGEEHVFKGLLEGNISQKPSGSNGFGYDCIFIPEGQSQTLAEMPLAEKNNFSHRYQAVKAFREHLKQFL